VEGPAEESADTSERQSAVPADSWIASWVPAPIAHVPAPDAKAAEPRPTGDAEPANQAPSIDDSTLIADSLESTPPSSGFPKSTPSTPTPERTAATTHLAASAATDAPVAVPTVPADGEVPADERASDAVRPVVVRDEVPAAPSSPGGDRGRHTVTQRPAGDLVREVVRQALREALTDIADTGVREGLTSTPRAVATEPISVGLPAAVPASPRVGSNSVSPGPDVADAAIDIDILDTVRQTPNTTGAHAGRERSGHGQEHELPAFARPAALAHTANVPASMVFPGQATFAAALDQAVPAHAGAPPSFSSQVLQHVGPQVIRGLQLQVAAGGGDMTLTLNPEHLGVVTIEVKVDRQRVVATLTSDTPAVRGWMAAHEQDLKAGLADLGLSLDELVVREDGRRDQQQPPNEQAARERGRKPKADETSQVFEIVV
jgi:hypothetical protein